MRAKVENKVLLTMLNLNFGLTIVLLLGFIVELQIPVANCGDNPMCGVNVVTPLLIGITSSALILRNLWKHFKNIFLACICMLVLISIGKASDSIAVLLGFKSFKFGIALALPLTAISAHTATVWRGEVESYNLPRDLIALALAPIVLLVAFFTVSWLFGV